MDLNNQMIGKRIRLLRNQHHLSQMTLAEIIDKSPTYMSLVENGQRCPSLKTLIDIANALKVSLDMLLIDHLKCKHPEASTELSAIMEDCSDFERIVIIDNTRALKRSLRENQHLLRTSMDSIGRLRNKRN